MPKYKAIMTIVVEAPSVSHAGQALGLDNLEFDADSDEVKTISVNLEVSELI